ncbi:uncharacterized protein [Antedon mediterranea]|uniref:uncharacterized protein n=1 Tax=Antedon mediterranea TaxID=105859 RepID=UPI003AF6035F
MSSDESDSEDEDGDSAAASSMSRLKLNQGLSEDDFKQLIVDIAAWYDGLRHIGMLKVLFKDIVDDNQTLERATTVIALLSQLVGPGKLNRNNLTILYDTVKVTKQSGFKSTIKEKLYHFRNIDTLQVTSFTKHRINILNFGKELTDSNIEFLDGRYNFPGLKMYKDSWSLITDFEIKGILKEENIEAFRKVLQQNGMESADRCFIHDEEMGTSQSKRQMTRYQDEDMGPSLPKRQKIRNKDEIIREYLFEQQRKFCIKANEFTPAIMQSRYKVDIAHMFTDLDLMKENQRKIDPKPIKLDDQVNTYLQSSYRWGRWYWKDDIT